jgi:hypothetical protein
MNKTVAIRVPFPANSYANEEAVLKSEIIKEAF